MEVSRVRNYRQTPLYQRQLNRHRRIVCIKRVRRKGHANFYRCRLEKNIYLSIGFDSLKSAIHFWESAISDLEDDTQEACNVNITDSCEHIVIFVFAVCRFTAVRQIAQCFRRRLSHKTIL